jgi:peptide/nickel transport system substrate-binding protein
LNVFFSRKRAGALVCLLLAAALLLASCRTPGRPEETTEPTEAVTEQQLPAGSITVPYTELDSLNPFFMKTVINASLVSLVYDSLFYLDVGFMPVKAIAADAVRTDGALRVSVDDARVFSDTSPLSAADVVYSFERAKEAPLYKEQLKNVSSCEAEGSYSVVFTLAQPDVNAENVLTFPIVKLGTADTADDIPVGSGCYRFARDELRVFLEYNLRHVGGIPEIGTVRLREVSESATLMHLLNTGSIDCFFSDMSDGVAKRSYAGANEIYLNNFVFLGVNHLSPMLGMADLRKAISLSLSRAALCENAFVSHARAAVTPLNPSWDEVRAVAEPQNAKYEADLNAAEALLSTLKLGVDGETLHYLLIVPDSNSFMRAAAQQIAEQLKLVNLDINVQVLSPTAVTVALNTGAYDFYLSEIKLTKNMDLSPFFTAGGAAACGIDLLSGSADETYADYRAGETELTRFTEAFDQWMPFIPLLYRNGQFCYSRAVKSGVEATEERLFLNVAGWKV